MAYITRSSSFKVSAEATGRLRLLWRALEARSAALDAAAAGVPTEVLRGLRHKGPVGRERALARILKVMPAKPFRQEARMVLWRVLTPEQDAIRVDLLSVGFGTGRFHRQPFGLAVSRHAIGRLLDRSGFIEDPADAILRAHDCLLGLTPEEGAAAFEVKSLTLPTKHGAFLVKPKAPATDSDAPFSMASTWVFSGQTWADQDAEIAAWHILASSPAVTINKDRV